MTYLVEICSNSVQSALNAQEAGAHRVELCDNLWESGTTPSLGTIKKARQLLTIDLFVLIRPRGGDFVYSNLEFEIMKEDIITCKKMGVNGIVSGVLNPDNTIDVVRTQELIELSKPLPFTFHRAFDITPNLEEALKQLIAIKATRVLTSGGKDQAVAACTELKKLNAIAKDAIRIMPGGGINNNNIATLFNTGSTEFHLSGQERFSSPATKATLKLNGTDDIPESDYFQSSVTKIAQVLTVLEEQFLK